MSIEFRCTVCQKLLRTPDDTAGREAKCPECGAVMQIPTVASGPHLEGSGSSPSPFALPESALPTDPGEAENPYQSPGEYAMPPSAEFFAPPGPIVPSRLEIGDALSRTWRIFTDQWLMCCAAWLIYAIIVGVVSQIVVQGSTLAAAATGDPVLGFVGTIFGQVAARLFNLWLTIGLWIFLLKIARGQQPSLGELFQGGRYYVTVLAAGLLLYLIIAAVAACFALPTLGIAWVAMPQADVETKLMVGLGSGIALAVVPCFIILLMYSQFGLLVVDREAGITESLRLSKEITSGNKLMIFAIGLVASVLAVLVGILTCCVGFLASYPFLALLWPVMYLIMTGQTTADQQHLAGASPFAPAAESPLADPDAPRE